MDKNVIAVDPGLQGGLAFLIDKPFVHEPPTLTRLVKRKSKMRGMHDVKVRDFNLGAICDLLRPFQGQNILFAIEKVSVRPQEGTIASFNFGAGYAYWKMAAVAHGFKLVEIPPQRWKNDYPQLTSTPEIMALKDQLKSLRISKKKSKGAADKNSNRKETEAINRSIKTIAKSAARTLAAKLYPELADSFKLKKQDGLAEAILIALYAKNHYNELVQTSTISSRNFRGPQSSKPEDEILPSSS
jgi:hypothetical protein